MPEAQFADPGPTQRQDGYGHPHATVVLVTGERLRMSPRQSWRLLTDRNSLVFFALACGLVGYLYPLHSLMRVPWWRLVVGFSLMGLLLLALLILVATAATRVFRLWPQIPALAPLTVLIAVIGVELVNRYFALFLWGPEWENANSLMQQTASDYMFFMVFEVLYSMFVLPTTRVYPEIRYPDQPAVSRPVVAPAQPAGDTARPMVRFAGQSFDPDRIRMIQADEHYIRVLTDKGSFMLRSRLQDAIEQLPVDIGLQIHRSYWVSYGFIVKSQRQPDGRLLLFLGDESQVAVPRARKRALEKALAERAGGDRQPWPRLRTSVRAGQSHGAQCRSGP